VGFGKPKAALPMSEAASVPTVQTDTISSQDWVTPKQYKSPEPAVVVDCLLNVQGRRYGRTILHSNHRFTRPVLIKHAKLLVSRGLDHEGLIRAIYRGAEVCQYPFSLKAVENIYEGMGYGDKKLTREPTITLFD
jgi:hypothetical protein